MNPISGSLNRPDNVGRAYQLGSANAAIFREALANKAMGFTNDKVTVGKDVVILNDRLKGSEKTIIKDMLSKLPNLPQVSQNLFLSTMISKGWIIKADK